jgi:hypothetical protein
MNERNKYENAIKYFLTLVVGVSILIIAQPHPLNSSYATVQSYSKMSEGPSAANSIIYISTENGKIKVSHNARLPAQTH